MRTVLICHEEDAIDRAIIAPWLASFSDLAGVILLRERTQRMKSRIKREIKRVGYLRFVDVLAFRLYYSVFIAQRDQVWRTETINTFRQIYPDVEDIPTIVTWSPNSPEAAQFLQQTQPDIAIARCKTLLKKEVFTLPKIATVVFHPGICPEYRNAHGCFWALANEDYRKVGMTLLKIDEGVDTGPIFGYYSYDYDASKESHFVIQTRVVTENLPRLQAKLESMFSGDAEPIDVRSRPSTTWGQPWLSKYFKIRRRKRREGRGQEPLLKV